MKKTVLIILVLTTVISLFPISIFAANSTVTNTLDMAELNEHANGSGYSWDNNELIFEMDNFHLSTADDFGLRLPGGSTVVLKGDNKITATRYGIHSFGALTFTGNGTLTITVADIGIRSAGSVEKENVIFRSGKIVINGASTGILVDSAKTVFSGANVDINAKVNSIYGNSIQFAGGNLSFVAPVKAKGSVEINAANLTASAQSSAIVADKGIKTDKVNISSGSSLDSLTSVDAYNGENAVKLVSTARVVKKGMLFGGKLPAFVDYIAFSLVIIAVASVIAVPLIIKKRRTDKLIAKSKVFEKNSK